jgi:hypothetical protein
MWTCLLPGGCLSPPFIVCVRFVGQGDEVMGFV